MGRGKKRTMETQAHISGTKCLQLGHHHVPLLFSASDLEISTWCSSLCVFSFGEPLWFLGVMKLLSLSIHCPRGRVLLCLSGKFGVCIWWGLCLLPGPCDLLCLEDADKGSWVRKPLPAGRVAWGPNARLRKLQFFQLDLPWNRMVQRMARQWQRTKGA